MLLSTYVLNDYVSLTRRLVMREFIVRPIVEEDALQVSDIGGKNFSSMKDEVKASHWVLCKILSYPVANYFVAACGDEVGGYILWTEHGGFRQEAVVELEQIAVNPNLQGNGIGLQLILQSFWLLKEYFESRGSVIKVVMVTTNAKNEAQKLYIKAFEQLGFFVSQKLVVLDMYRDDELMLVFKKPVVRPG